MSVGFGRKVKIKKIINSALIPIFDIDGIWIINSADGSKFYHEFHRVLGENITLSTRFRFDSHLKSIAVSSQSVIIADCWLF